MFNRTVVRAVALVAAFSLVMSGIFFYLQTAHAVSDGVGTLTVSVLPQPGNGGSEHLIVSFAGTGTIDLEGWEVTDAASFSYLFGAVSLTDGESVKVCGNGESGVGCDDEWGGADTVWNNDGDTFTITADEDGFSFSFTYSSSTEDVEVSDSVAVDFAPEGTIVIAKVVATSSIAFADDEFEFTNHHTESSFSLGHNETIEFAELAPQTYLFSEVADEDWELESIVCTNASGTVITTSTTTSVSVELEDEAVITCTFTNVYIGEVPGLTITAPALDGQTLPTAPYTFTADYVDEDDEIDVMRWAIRTGGGSCNGETLAGNVGGFDDTFSFDGADFAATVDMSDWEDGTHCLVLNPAETGDGEDFRAIRTFELETPPATLDITAPDVDDSVLPNEAYTFTAEYVDNDSEVDEIKWAIRFETCDADDAATVAGNVAGFEDPSTFGTTTFAATVDLGALEPGEYCFVVNPQEGDDEDLRATRTFVLEEEEPIVCLPGANVLANASFEEPVVTKNRGWDLLEPVGWTSERVSNGNSSDMEFQRGVNGWLSSHGAQHIELGVKKATEVSQIVPTVEGKMYTLSWDFSARPETAEGENKLSVQVDGDEVAFNVADGSANENTDWQTYTYEFEGTGEEIEILFADHGKDNGKGTFLDNVALECVPQEIIEYGPYCGDGIVNQEWETCDAGHLLDDEEWGEGMRKGTFDRSCTMQCQSAYQCTDLPFAQIDLEFEEAEQFSFNGAIYVGQFQTAIPNEAWFLLEQSDKPANKIANKTNGLGVSWNAEAAAMDVALRGGNARAEFDKAIGEVNFLGSAVTDSADNIVFTGYKLETEARNNADTLEVIDENEIVFEMYADTGKDGFTLFASSEDLDPHSCPTCLATVEARVVALEGGVGATGEATMEERVFLGDGSEVAFGEWFQLFDGEEYIVDEDDVQSFENPAEKPGLFVSRRGGGDFRVRLYGRNEQGAGREFVNARIEIRDAQIEAGSLAVDKFETHGESGYDDAVELEDLSGVDVFMRVGTGIDDASFSVDHFSINACKFESDDKLYTVAGYKWNDENQDGVWDQESESTLAGWQIDITNGSTTYSTTTNADGYYTFTVPEGEWWVSEVQQYGWEQTYPFPYEERLTSTFEDELDDSVYAPGMCHFSFYDRKPRRGNQVANLDIEIQGATTAFLAEDEGRGRMRDRGGRPDGGAYECNFGNYFYAYTVSGYKWNDENQDGVWEQSGSSTEPTLAGWTIELTNGSTTYTALTDEDGYYEFTFTESGEWTVSEVQQEGWVQTAPVETGSCSANFGNVAEEEVDSLQCDFGNYFEGTDEVPELATCSISASPEAVISGGTTVVSWSTTGATNVDISLIGTDLALSGSTTVFVDTDKVFTMTASNGLSTSTCSVTVTEERDNDSSGGVVIDNNIQGEVLGVSTTNGQVLGAATSQCSALYIEDYMQAGWANDPAEVMKLQFFLTGQGFVTPATGVFDSTTDANVRLFQTTHAADILQPWVDAGLSADLSPTGYVYKMTRWKINDLQCTGSEPRPVL